MLIPFWLVLVFVIGSIVGSFLNVCVARLPAEKSILWPGSRCGHCYRPIRWSDNLPLLGYLWLWGRCRDCHTRFSSRYFFVELLTALGFVGLFYAEVVLNVHGWPTLGQGEWMLEQGSYPWQWFVGFGWHAVLFSFLMVTAFCDLDGRQIPLTVTLPGTVIGLAGAALMPWPWPWDAAGALAQVRAVESISGAGQPWFGLPPGVGPQQGVYPWPVWGPAPAWLPYGSWQMGLLTGVVGALAGTFLTRMIAFLCEKGLGREALGLGDADLMMMAGAFLGWQVVVVAFFVSAIPGLFVGVFQILRGDNSLPFGPSLALGILMTMLGWKWLGPYLQVIFFWPWLMAMVVLFGAVFLFLSSFLLRLLRGLRGAE